MFMDVDPSGQFVLTLTTIAGAALIGAAVSATLSITHQYLENGEIDPVDTVKAAFIGAGGAVIGVVTASLVGIGFAAAGITTAFTASQAFAIGATTGAITGMTVRAHNTVMWDCIIPKP